ncbi:MAG: cupin domain-containing protein [Candidatus Omnitrophica bacterium]|nr:cupin domain-containing protein [Candidatus Omnitrophota bacterium]
MKKVFIIFIIFMQLLSCSWAIDAENIEVKTLAKSTLSWDGEALPEYPRGTPEVTILKITIPPDVKLPLHEHPVINAGVITKGELTVTTEKGEILHLKKDDTIIEVVDKWHYGQNEGDVPAEIIVFYAGIKNEPVTVLSDNK